MQLSTLVLPAPLGPIRQNSSPASTANEMPSRTASPPKRRRRSMSSSSAIPSPAAAILFDLAIAAPRAPVAGAEIEFLDIAMRAQARRVTVEHHAAIFQDIGVVG